MRGNVASGIGIVVSGTDIVVVGNKVVSIGKGLVVFRWRKGVNGVVSKYRVPLHGVVVEGVV